MGLDARAVLRDVVDSQMERDRPKACKICGAEALPFAAVDFGKSCEPGRYPLGRYGVDIPYYRCVECHFIFTPTFDHFTPEQWSGIVYNSDYAKVDPAYAAERPKLNAFVAEAYLKAIGERLVGLDFGGGNGAMASLLRRRGWAYDSVDPFGGGDYVSANGGYNFCTSFEVFEHVPDPRASLADLLRRCNPGRLLVLIGTNVSDGMVSLKTGLNWWYAAPRNGHISLYSRDSIKILAREAGLGYFSLGRNLHFLSRGHERRDVFRISLEGKLRRLFNNVGAMGAPSH
ncbi:MAG TPA: class I SAM-dependent methyltransferase [Caulobacteraceae bacterium]|jgi:hypothetical protein